MRIAPAQRAAMESGSMFGWTVPAADPNQYDAHGKPLPQHAIKYAIYQLGDNPEANNRKFVSFAALKSIGKDVDANQYQCVYSEILRPPAEPPTNQQLLNNLYYRFNMEHPADFKGHSLSVSDVITIERSGLQRSFFVDSFGFTELKSFAVPKEHQNSIDGDKSAAQPDKSAKSKTKKTPSLDEPER